MHMHAQVSSGHDSLGNRDGGSLPLIGITTKVIMHQHQGTLLLILLNVIHVSGRGADIMVSMNNFEHLC